MGIATSLFSPHGFVGCPDSDIKRKHLYSALLLAAAIIALGISVLLQGQMFYADILPFIGLFIVNDRFQSRIPKNPG